MNRQLLWAAIGRGANRKYCGYSVDAPGYPTWTIRHRTRGRRGFLLKLRCDDRPATRYPTLADAKYAAQRVEDAYGE